MLPSFSPLMVAPSLPTIASSPSHSPTTSTTPHHPTTTTCRLIIGPTDSDYITLIIAPTTTVHQLKLDALKHIVARDQLVVADGQGDVADGYMVVRRLNPRVLMGRLRWWWWWIFAADWWCWWWVVGWWWCWCFQYYGAGLYPAGWSIACFDAVADRLGCDFADVGFC